MPSPDIVIFFGQQKVARQEPVNIFAYTGVNVATAPRLLRIYATNTGAVRTGPYRLVLRLPSAISVVSAPNAIVTRHDTKNTEEPYTEVKIESDDSVERNDVPQVIAEISISGLVSNTKILWDFFASDYATSGGIRVALN